MKKFFIQFGTSAILLFLMVAWNGCDSFNSLPLNIPFTIDVSVQGSAATLSDSQSYCLSTDSETYNEYRDKIQSLHFVEAAYRTTGVVPTNLTGNITVTLQDDNGNVLFSYDIPGATPADYMTPNSPYILQLNQSQIDFINTYLNNLLSQGACFTATVTVSNITGQPPYTVEGAIDMVIEADTEL
jgi:hypothetical protein